MNEPQCCSSPHQTVCVNLMGWDCPDDFLFGLLGVYFVHLSLYFFLCQKNKKGLTVDGVLCSDKKKA